jgi:FKBP-type peptidyl-prolyl cis-trans isomerase (trigger factor)
VVVTDEDVTAQVDELRERFAKLSPVERAAADGDFLTLDLVATIDGAEVPGGTGERPELPDRLRRAARGPRRRGARQERG